MPRSRLDHIVITAPSLAVGVDYVRQALGVAPQVGGEHQRMGTHFHLLQLGPKVYLEVISVNPKAPRPDRMRWFGLDALGPDEPPRLTTWIARTDDIEAAASASPVSLGCVEPMRREQLHWRITVPEDGSLPCGGIAPMLIQWPPAMHPTSRLQDLGCSLVALEGFHPEPAKVSTVLSAIGFDGEFTLRPLSRGARPYLVAHIRSPVGCVSLGAPSAEAAPH